MDFGKRFERDIQNLLKYRVEEILKEVTDNARIELIKKLKKEATNIALNISLHTDFKYHADRIIITIRQETDDAR